ncbi:MAG TPA: hypothetical protein VK851_09380 [Anaerolineales bacterium]|nr:hypothetical protein [Anaerolineales bacterium]
MDTTLNTSKSKRPFLAGFWLIPAIPVFVLILLPIMKSLGVGDVYTPAGITVMFIVHFGAGYLWARSLGFRLGLPTNKIFNVFGGLGFALGVVGIILLILSNPNESHPIVRWMESFKGAGNLEFGILFAPWTGLVCGISGLALGIGLKDLKLSLKLLVLGFITGLGLYLAIMFAMQFLGFKVGSGRPVMLPTTFLSMWVTALVGSAIFGKVIGTSNEEGSHAQI